MKMMLLFIVILSFVARLTYEIREHSNHVIKMVTDERGLTSVVFQQDGKVWGLDYLTRAQVDSLNNILHH